MSNYEKEKLEGFKAWAGLHRENLVNKNIWEHELNIWDSALKWQASRLTIDKIISILEDHSSTTDSGATLVLESVHKEDWHKAAKEILALLKGENEK